MMDQFIAKFNEFVEKIEDLFAKLYNALLGIFNPENVDGIFDIPNPLG